MGPSKITLNFAISKFVSPAEIEFHGNLTACVLHCKFRRRHFSPRISPAKFFAGINFSPAPIFRQRRFSPVPFFAGSIFRCTHPSCWAQKHQVGVSASFSKRQAKQPQATSMHPLVTGEIFHFYSFIMTITIVIACQPPIPTSEFCNLNVLPVFHSAGWLP